MNKNPYKNYSFQMLRVLEQSFLRTTKDSTLTPKEQANARTNLARVREAMAEK